MQTIHQKLRIKPGMKLLTVGAPADFKKEISNPELDLSISPSLKKFDQVHWFVKKQADVDKEADKIFKMLSGDIVCWIYFPKGSSGIQTDLTRDKGWDTLQKNENLKWLSLISFNETWSTFAMRLSTEKDEKQLAAAQPRPIFDYIDPIKKTVTIPDDLAKAFKKEKEASTYFNSLAFSHRKEYVEWIVTAKKEETRATRVAGTIERLKKQWKNRSNR